MPGDHHHRASTLKQQNKSHKNVGGHRSKHASDRKAGAGRIAPKDARARGAGAVDPGALAAAAVAGPPTDGRVLTPASAVFA